MLTLLIIALGLAVNYLCGYNTPIHWGARHFANVQPTEIPNRYSEMVADEMRKGILTPVGSDADKAGREFGEFLDGITFDHDKCDHDNGEMNCEILFPVRNSDDKGHDKGKGKGKFDE